MDIVSLVLGLCTELAKAYNTAEAKNYNDSLSKLQQQLLYERAKGQLSDDGQIEYLIGQIKIQADAFLRHVATLSIAKG
jgi:hypothetical protein